MLSPGVKPAGKVFLPRTILCYRRKAFFPASFLSWRHHTSPTVAASMTVETALALPVFLFAVLAVMQLFHIYDYAQRSAAALTQTAEELAIGAYTSEFQEEESILGTVLSAAYASARASGLAGESKAVRNENYLLSTFLKEDDQIDLILTYQMKSPFGMIPFPSAFFVQRAMVRGWTGREGSSGETEASEEGHTIVYVTENGRVYHRSRSCTHLKLSISQVSLDAARSMKNVYLARYKQCERCGRNCGNQVYITTDGDRYHATLDCPGLKRTIHEVYLEEITLPPCSKCGGAE